MSVIAYKYEVCTGPRLFECLQHGIRRVLIHFSRFEHKDDSLTTLESFETCVEAPGSDQRIERRVGHRDLAPAGLDAHLHAAHFEFDGKYCNVHTHRLPRWGFDRELLEQRPQRMPLPTPSDQQTNTHDGVVRALTTVKARSKFATDRGYRAEALARTCTAH